MRFAVCCFCISSSSCKDYANDFVLVLLADGSFEPPIFGWTSEEDWLGFLSTFSLLDVV